MQVAAEAVLLVLLTVNKHLQLPVVVTAGLQIVEAMELQILAEAEAGPAQEAEDLAVPADQVLLFCGRSILLNQSQAHLHTQRQMNITSIRLPEMGALSTNGYS
jgi:hypothetical protein